MHFVNLRPAAVGICFLATTFAGCGATPSALGGNAMPPNLRTSRPAIDQSLYVANGRNNTVTQYAIGIRAPERTIDQTHGVNGPQGIAADVHGYLYVANDNSSTVTVYAPGHTNVSRTISQSISGPGTVALDAAENVYVANRRGNTVTVYAAGRTVLLQAIADGINSPAALAFDAAGNLFVANEGSNNGAGSVTVYHGTASSMKKIGTITTGIDRPVALAADPSGQNVFVVNELGENVSEYSARTFQRIRAINQYMSFPDALAFDVSGNLYVTNKYGLHGQGSMTVYAHDTYAWTNLISGVSAPDAIVGDPLGNVFVANDPAANTSVMGYGSYGWWITIDETTGHVAGPVALAIGP